MSQHLAVSPRDAVLVNTHNLTLAHHRVPSSSVVEHPTRSRRVLSSNPIWASEFFRVYVSPRICVIFHNYNLTVYFLWTKGLTLPQNFFICFLQIVRLTGIFLSILVDSGFFEGVKKVFHVKEVCCINFVTL